MQTPILTKNQQKQSLSGKKKPREKCLRNVLAKPKGIAETVIDNDTAGGILNALERCVKLCNKTTKPNEEVSTNKKEKSNQKIRRKALQDSGMRKLLFLGVNAVTRAVESGSGVRSVLVEKDVDPAFMVSHIGTLCSVHDVPCIVLPGLRNSTQKEFGFPCISIGLKECNNNEDDRLYELQQVIVEAFATSASQRSAASSMDINRLSGELMETENIQNLTETPVLPFSSNIYLYRASTKERTFLPKKAKGMTEEYISFGLNDDSDISVKPVTGISANFPVSKKTDRVGFNMSQVETGSVGLDVEYIQPEIKRMRPNPDKKRKIKLIKTKVIK